jgi:hypothetical protein
MKAFRKAARKMILPLAFAAIAAPAAAQTQNWALHPGNPTSITSPLNPMNPASPFSSIYRSSSPTGDSHREPHVWTQREIDDQQALDSMLVDPKATVEDIRPLTLKSYTDVGAEIKYLQPCRAEAAQNGRISAAFMKNCMHEKDWALVNVLMTICLASMVGMLPAWMISTVAWDWAKHKGWIGKKESPAPRA